MTCKDRIRDQWAGRKADLRVFMGDPDGNEDIGSFYDYGLAFDYVTPGTFKDQTRGYWRYQLSWGGPSDEIRFYGEVQGFRAALDRADYHFMDWFDGAKINVTDEPVVQWLWQHFADCESLQCAREQALKEE